MNDNRVITKSYLDQFHEKIEQSTRYLGIEFYVESTDLVKDNQNNKFVD